MKKSLAEKSLEQTVDRQKQAYDVLMKRYKQLETVFEEIMVKEYALAELRDVWRKRAGLPTKCN